MAETKPANPFGFLIVDKPQGMTSHDVVARVRRLIGIKKVGHAGTLDPMATGILVLCIGLATRLSDYAMHGDKRYLAAVQFGFETDTYDAEGEVVATYPTDGLTCDVVAQAAAEFVGEIDQVPPMYSAIKVKGKKLYELAREGKTVERQARRVTIHSIKMTDCDLPQVTLDVHCSSGTYIRSLAFDLGKKLDVGGHLTALRRVGSGDFTIEDAVSLDDLATEDWQQNLVAPDRVLLDLPVASLSAESAEDVRQGRRITLAELTGLDGELARAYDPDGNFFALLKSDGHEWRPYKVFYSQP